jgi:hypothetical protein
MATEELLARPIGKLDFTNLDLCNSVLSDEQWHYLSLIQETYFIEELIFQVCIIQFLVKV